jgi:hypothetical protein
VDDTISYYLYVGILLNFPLLAFIGVNQYSDASLDRFLGSVYRKAVRKNRANRGNRL